jgi:hypothetical protein
MATAANVVKFKRSAVSGKVPATADLALGEIALNTYDGVVYLKKSVSAVETVVKLQPFPTGGTNGQILSIDSNGNLIWATSGATSSGTVTSTSVVSANGFSGTVATADTTPAITIQTTVTGLLKGNGTAISAATSGTDYLAPGSLSITTLSPGSQSLSYSNGVFTFTPANLSSYVTSTSLSSTLGSYVTSTSLSSTLGNYVTSSTLSSFNYITLTNLSMDTPGAASGSGGVAYSNTTGKFKYTPPDLSSFITSGIATLSSLTSIGSTGVDTTAKGNLKVNGNLTVDGNTTTPGDILVNNISVAGSLTKAVFLYQDGNLTIYTGTVRWYASQPVTVTKIIARLAQASDIGVTVQIRKNGAVVKTINIAGNSLKTTISTGLFNMAVDDYLTVDTTAIGNANNTGSGLSVQFSYYYS